MPNYVWSDPTRPVTIRLSLSVLGRLAVPGPVSGSIGLLLGRSVLEDARHIIFIENFEPVELEHLEESLARHKDAVGMYRAQASREFPQIQPDEAVLFGQYFTRPDALFLLLHPRLERAAFFIVEGDEFALVHQFTFRAAKPDASKWSMSRTQQRGLEVLALLAGIVAGAALFQHFQPPHFSQAASAMPQTMASARPVRSYPADPEPLPSPFAAPQDPLPEAPPPPVRRVEKAGVAERAAAEDPPDPSPSPAPRKAAPETPAPAAPATPTPAPAAAPAKPVAAASTPAPAPVPVRNIPVPQPDILVDAEPVGASRIGKVVGHIPLLRRLHKAAPPLVPPEPVRRVDPKLSSADRAELTDPVNVDVRVYVDEGGKVEYAELLSSAKHHPNLSSAAVYAARRWDFKPAVQGGQHVPGEVILHYRFVPAGPPPPAVRGQN